MSKRHEAYFHGGEMFISKDPSTEKKEVNLGGGRIGYCSSIKVHLESYSVDNDEHIRYLDNSSRHIKGDCLVQRYINFHSKSDDYSDCAMLEFVTYLDSGYCQVNTYSKLIKDNT
jgi:hypothetical protein